MEIRYQLVILGNNHPFIPEIKEIFFKDITELGVGSSFINLLDSENFKTEFKGNSPAYCLYFGDENGAFSDLEILEILIEKALLILPIVPDLKKFGQAIPGIIQHINGVELKTKDNIPAIASYILEGFEMLRLSRKIFLSYRRDESAEAAVQLFEEFEKRGYNVYLDTHSTDRGISFQQELLHQLADTDVMIMLNTRNYLVGRWTKEELKEANAMKVGVVQLLWPNQSIESFTEISSIFRLRSRDFVWNPFSSRRRILKERTIVELAKQVEFLRARTLAARQGNIIAEFVAAAKRTGKKTAVNPTKLIKLNNAKGDELTVIPAVGVPEAYLFHRSTDRATEYNNGVDGEHFLLYDHVNIRDNWMRHLGWLDNHLPIKGIKISEAETWLNKI